MRSPEESKERREVWSWTRICFQRYSLQISLPSTVQVICRKRSHPFTFLSITPRKYNFYWNNCYFIYLVRKWTQVQLNFTHVKELKIPNGKWYFLWNRCKVSLLLRRSSYGWIDNKLDSCYDLNWFKMKKYSMI